MRLDSVELLICLPVPLGNASINVTANNVFVEICPASDNSLGAIVDNSDNGLIRFCRSEGIELGKNGKTKAMSVGLHLLTFGIKIRIDAHNGNSAWVTHTLFSYAQDHVIIFVELDSLDGSLEFPSLKALSSLNIPKSSGIVCRSSNSHRASSCGRDKG